MPAKRSLGVLIAALLVTVGAVPAEHTRHLRLTGSFPSADTTLVEPPESVTLWFNQTPALAVSSIRMTGPTGPVTLSKVRAMEHDDLAIGSAVETRLRAGHYEVVWRTAGDDGHVLRGSFAFVIAPAGR